MPERARHSGVFAPTSQSAVAGSSGEDSESSGSDSSSSTNRSDPSPRPTPSPRRPPPIPSTSSNTNTTSLQNFSRPSLPHASSDSPARKNSPLIPSVDLQRHKRQHSQGFFEPSLPTTSITDHSSMANLTASQIAAQAAMQHQTIAQHIRKRSQTLPQHSPPEAPGWRQKPPPIQTQSSGSRKRSPNGAVAQQYQNGIVGGHTVGATAAANAAFPRSTQTSPSSSTFQEASGKESKSKSDRSKIKLFSKPKHIAISSYKDSDRKDRPLPSPNKMGPSGPSGLSQTTNASTTSLVDSLASGTSSIYSANNASTSTLVPGERQLAFEKEKAHKHNFLSRQKNKLHKTDDHSLPLSSASSNSKPLDPNAPQSLYSFAPTSPGHSTTSFSKSVSGLDLRHGGRALREKKKEEKVLGNAFDTKRSDTERTDWASTANLSTSAGHPFLEPTAMSARSTSQPGDNPVPSTLQGFGVSNMTPEEAWDFLKAKLLITFEGEQLQTPIEDLNQLVSVYLQQCIKKEAPTIIIEDLRELLQTGFISLNQTLRDIPDDRLVPRLVEVWLRVFGKIVTYMQAVFLPLDLEFRGHGPLMTKDEAADFWGVDPKTMASPIDNELEVRRMVLVSFRDNIILPRHDLLKAKFSRLSLESVSADPEILSGSPNSVTGGRPGTAASLDPGFASYNSQGSTLLADSEGARSRATSNTSAPELPSFGSPPAARRQMPPPPPPMDSAQVTEIVGRMLQCISVLMSIQSGDDAQRLIEELRRELTHNWLGRGRTGRNRRGFVGTRVTPSRDVGLGLEMDGKGQSSKQ